MRIKTDKFMVQFAQEVGLPTKPYGVGKALCLRFIKKGMLEDVPDYYGASILTALGPQYIKDVCEEIKDCLHLERISSDAFDAFCKLTLMGDGDCPHCGGDVEFMETYGHELNDGDYMTPNSYVVDGYVYRCKVCNQFFKSKIEL